MILQNAEEAAEIKKRRQFRKFSYRGVDLEAYVTPSTISDCTISNLQREKKPYLARTR